MGYGVDFSKNEFTEEDYKIIMFETTKIIENETQDQEEIGTAYYNRGLVYYSQHEEEKAIPDFSVAIEIMPCFSHAWFMRAASYYMFFEYEKALNDARKAFELDKTDQQCIIFIEK
jgi:tetratricopeptide (TPR) repeat protein